MYVEKLLLKFNTPMKSVLFLFVFSPKNFIEKLWSKSKTIPVSFFVYFRRACLFFSSPYSVEIFYFKRFYRERIALN